MIPFAPNIQHTREIIKTPDFCFTGKQLARTIIAGDRYLSVPVVGGSSHCKRPVLSDSLVISNHGRWREEHLGAWSATYGKTPFFPYIFPELERVYIENSHTTLEEFNNSIFQIAVSFLSPSLLIPSLVSLKASNPMRYSEIKREYEGKVNLNYSIFDALFRLGRNSIWVCLEE